MKIDFMADDIRNDYLQASTLEKHYVIFGTGFGLDNTRKVSLITGDLYGENVSSCEFWNHLQTCMDFLGFTSNLSDPGVWRHKATNSDGSKYYDYVLHYTKI